MRTSEQRIEWLFINMRWFLLLAVASVIEYGRIIPRIQLSPRCAADRGWRGG